MLSRRLFLCVLESSEMKMEEGLGRHSNTCVCFESASSGVADGPLLILMGGVNR